MPDYPAELMPLPARDDDRRGVTESGRRHRERRTALAMVVGGAGVAGAALVVLPDTARLDSISPFAQLVSFRPALVTLTLAVTLVVAVRRRWRATALGLAVVALVGAALLVPRTIGSGEANPPGGRNLVVLTLNVYNGRADPTQVAELIRAQRPDLVSLPEAGPRFRMTLAAELAGSGYLLPDVGGGTEVGSVSVALATSLGDVDVTTTRTSHYPQVVVTGGKLGPLRIVAFHAVAPVPSTVAQWVEGLQDLRSWCSSGQPTVVAGDLNATLDHSVLREAMTGCVDSGALLGKGLVATWPSNLPPILGIQIDHVLTTGGVPTSRFEVFDVAGTDHRAVLAALGPWR